MPTLFPGNPRFDELGFPHPGTKLRFRGTNAFWFTNMIEDAERLLVVDHGYTLKTIEVYSSWASIRLEEFPDTDFTLSFFDYPRPPQRVP